MTVASFLASSMTSGGAGPAPVRVTFNAGSGMFEGETAQREGQIGGQLHELLISLPSPGGSGGDVWRFTQQDAHGRAVGVNSASLVPALAGYTVRTVAMPAGVHTPEDVAEAFRVATAAVYASATRSGRAVTITDPSVDGDAAGLPPGSSGSGGMLGTLDVTPSTEYAQTDSNVCTLVTPTFSEPMLFVGLAFRIGTNYSGTLRSGVYLNGANSAPAGSVLLDDQGEWPGTMLPDGWAFFPASSAVLLPSATRLQVLLVGRTSTATAIGYQGSGSAGDWEVSPGGIFQATAAIPATPSASLPSTFPAGGSVVSSTTTFCCRVLYRPLRHDGYFSTRYGVHVPASALGFTTNPTANVIQGGSLPPQLEGLEVHAAAIAAEDSAGFRMAAMQGGALEDADGATTLLDFGRGPTGSGLPRAWYELSVGDDTHAVVDRTQRLWFAARSDGGETVAFSNVAGPGTAGPDTDPMDWPDNTSGNRPEYESFASNPAFSVDPDDPFESSFIANTTNAPVDTLPGNVQGNYLRLRSPAVTVESA